MLVSPPRHPMIPELDTYYEMKETRRGETLTKIYGQYLENDSKVEVVQSIISFAPCSAYRNNLT